MMKKPPFIIALILFFALAPVYLAVIQNVPARSAFQQVVLLLSLGAFGLVLGQFWLSRLLPRDAAGIPTPGVIRFHKIIGSIIGAFLLLHPGLMIARRFWVEESNPLDNLALLLLAPALLPGIIAWVLLVAIVLLALPPVRRCLRGSTWRRLHGLLSLTFVGLATWHVVAVGRHSSLAMSAFWIALAAGSLGALLLSYRPAHRKILTKSTPEFAHETAR